MSVFGLAACGMAVILGGCASIFNALANLSDEEMMAVCPGTSTAETTDFESIVSFEPLEEVKDLVKEIDSLNDLSSYYMCSPTCPCKRPSESII